MFKWLKLIFYLLKYNSADWKVRRAAAGALGELGDQRTVNPLVKALGDCDVIVRSIAAEALGKLGDARAVEPLIKALGDRDVTVSSAAAGH